MFFKLKNRKLYKTVFYSWYCHLCFSIVRNINNFSLNALLNSESSRFYTERERITISTSNSLWAKDNPSIIKQTFVRGKNYSRLTYKMSHSNMVLRKIVKFYFKHHHLRREIVNLLKYLFSCFFHLPGFLRSIFLFIKKSIKM